MVGSHAVDGCKTSSGFQFHNNRHAPEHLGFLCFYNVVSTVLVSQNMCWLSLTHKGAGSPIWSKQGGAVQGRKKKIYSWGEIFKDFSPLTQKMQLIMSISKYNSYMVKIVAPIIYQGLSAYKRVSCPSYASNSNSPSSSSEKERDSDTMEVLQVLHMNGGNNQTSYASNSSLQVPLSLSLSLSLVLYLLISLLFF